MSKINQKEYLKRYLTGEKIKKKKKKKKEVTGTTTRIRIIDDDIDVIKNHVEDDDLILTGEDAPQIVGIVDDRPPELKTMEDFRGSEKWKKLSSNIKERSIRKADIENVLKTAKYKEKDTVNLLSDDDLSPSSKRKDYKRQNSSDFSPPRKQSKTKIEEDDDLSPRRKHNKNVSPIRRNSYDDDDLSPQRKHYKNDNLTRKKSIDSDYSPPRKSNRSENSRIRSRSDRRDYSPNNGNYSKSTRTSRRADNSNYSPTRNTDKYDSTARSRNDNFTPPRKQYDKNDKITKFKRKSLSKSPDRSPPRKTNSFRNSRKDSTDYSPPRRESTKRANRNDDSPINEEKQKNERTLDGRKTGLQDASSLKKEIELFRKKEDEMFKKMSSKIPGKDGEINVRNSRRKTTAQIEREQEREREKDKREQEKQKIYSRWGVGLKQIENYENKIAAEMHEINKPLARYSNDADLDEMLKKQERLGDPMLEYIREKQKEENKNSKIATLPIYKGSFPENRFNIRPGYRWDGVDRSNGYEKKWFDVQNQKKANQEEAYKYSVEDM